VNAFKQLSKILPYASFYFIFVAGLAAAEALPEKFLLIDGHIAEDGSRIQISWPKPTGTKNGRVTIQRRTLGEKSKSSWKSIASLRSFTRVYTDTEIQSGTAYEYRISRPSKKKIETGYWVAGHHVPAVENQGVAIVLVDETISKALSPSLNRFSMDLIGDGWKVVRHYVPRGNAKNAVSNLKAAQTIRAWLKRQYYSNPSLPHSLILVGHVPVVKSGHSNPDGHKRRPLETDLFYADMDGIWHDDGKGVLRHNRVPSDHIEMQVGRIDFSSLDSSLGDEVALLKKYFNKNHLWRHGRLGDLRQAYGGNNYLIGESNALRNIVGPKKFIKGGHHDVGKEQPWLFGVDFGSWKYADYVTPKPIQTIFSINFGSGKLGFSGRNNTMKAMLAQSQYGLATGWGARPTWQLHHMALGKPIGYSHLRTVNNGKRSFGGADDLEYTPTGKYTWLNPIWVNLLGDPTLHPFPLNPVQKLLAKKNKNGVQLSWGKPNTESVVQYRVYRALNRLGPYERLNPSDLLSENQFFDPNPITNSWYMIRAYSLKEVYAGSFYTFSQGVVVPSVATP